MSIILDTVSGAQSELNRKLEILEDVLFKLEQLNEDKEAGENLKHVEEFYVDIENMIDIIKRMKNDVEDTILQTAYNGTIIGKE